MRDGEPRLLGDGDVPPGLPRARGVRGTLAVAAAVVGALALSYGITAALASRGAAAPPTPAITDESASNLTPTGATVGASINPEGFSTSYVVNYGPTTTYGQQTPSTAVGSERVPQPVSQTLSGLTPNTVYHFQFAATNDGGTTDGADDTFTTAAQPAPTVSGEAAQDVTPTSATLVASVNPNGGATTYLANYGTTTSYGQQTSSGSAGSGTTAGQVSEQVTGLLPNTTYHFQFVATNAGGPADGTDATFTTAPPPAPTVSGETPEDVTGTSATLLASIDANGGATTYVIDYGTSTSYGQVTSSSSVGAGSTATETSQPVSGLLPDTTYHFRFVATNAGGSTDGNDTTFTTGSAATTTPTTTTATAGKPTVVGESAESVSSTSATLLASIDPNGAATTDVVDYGTTSSYGEQSASASVGSGSTPQQASQTLTGLQPSTTYHYRFVATSSAGTTSGTDATFTTASKAGQKAPPPPPVKGVSVDTFPVSGRVLVNGKPLTAGEQIPFGSIVDADNGTLLLESVSPTGKLQSARFWDGTFKLVSPSNHLTGLDLQGGNFGICSTRGARQTAAAAGTPSSTTAVRSLWGSGHGQFLTQGRYAAATVRGTIWETVDRCDGTLIRVTQDTVAVTDLQTGKVYEVAAGHGIVILAP